MGYMQFWSYPALAILRERSRSFEEIAASSDLTATMTIAERPEKEEGEIITASYFPMLGVKAALGRTFLPEEDSTPETHPVIIIGHEFWHRRLGGAQDVVGKTVYLNNFPFTIVGVLPEGFRGQSGAAEFWVPTMMAGQLRFKEILTSPGAYLFKVIARLKFDVSFEQAHSEVSALAEEIVRTLPRSRSSDSGKEATMLIPLKDTKVDPAIRRAFLILLAAVACVLLIACANVANLLLARAIARQREFAVRLALGAGRGRIIRQVLTESVLLAALGAGAGLVVAYWGIEWLTTAKPWNTTGFWSQYAKTFDYFPVKLDAPVLIFNLLLGLVTGIIFGLAPTRQASRLQVSETLKEGEGSSAKGFRSLRRPGVRSALVTGEIALSVVLLAGAGLMIKSFARLTSVDLGFEPEGVVTMEFDTERQELDSYRSLLERVQALPGVEAASLANTTPLYTINRHMMELNRGAQSNSEKVMTGINIVTPDYFKTLRIALLKGRGLTEQDRVGSPRVAVVNRAMAELLWPGEEPIGKRIETPFRAGYENAEKQIEVVGVVEDVKYRTVEEPSMPVYYLSAWQPTLGLGSLVIRASDDPASVIAAARREMQSFDKNAPLYHITTMSERAAKAASRYRYSALMMGLFAILALLLAALGIYGVMAYTVSARTREIGIRIALGAQPGQIVKHVIAEGAVLILVGLTLGLAVASAVTQALTSQLYQVQATDPTAFVVATLILMGAALLACYVPARRATRVDPMIALRYE